MLEIRRVPKSLKENLTLKFVILLLVVATTRMFIILKVMYSTSKVHEGGDGSMVSL
jgi:hypothetical protein